MYIIGKTQYIKNLKSELNSKKQLTQIYFVIYGLLVAQLLGAVEKTGNNIVKTSAILYILIFLITMLSYYEEVTKTVNLTNLNISNINYQGILAGGAFSFSVFLYMIAAVGVIHVQSINVQTNIFCSFIILIFLCSYLSAKTLIISIKKEVTINEIVDEMIKLRSNRIINTLKERFGITENFAKYFIGIMLTYIVYMSLSVPFFVILIKVPA